MKVKGNKFKVSVFVYVMIIMDARNNKSALLSSFLLPMSFALHLPDFSTNFQLTAHPESQFYLQFPVSASVFLHTISSCHLHLVSPFSPPPSDTDFLNSGSHPIDSKSVSTC